MKTPKEFYVVMDNDGRMWAGYNSFTTRPWQAKIYSSRKYAEETAERFEDCRVVKAKITFEFLEG